MAGHGGGLVGGVLLGYLLGYNERRPETFFHKLPAYLMVIVTGLVLAWAVASAIMTRFGVG
jgi:rhomboid protease GluP